MRATNKNLKTRMIWSRAMCKELGRLAQGHKDLAQGTNTAFFMEIEDVKNTPKDRTVTCARIVSDCHPQKEDPN